MDEFDTLGPKPIEPEPQPQRRRRFSGRKMLLVAVVATVAALAGGITTTAISHEGGRWFGGGIMHMGMRGDASDPAAMGKHIERMMAHLAIEIDATPEQQSKLAEIAKAAVADLLPLREQWRGARGEAIALLTGATVDRAAIEEFRTSHLQLADTASKRLAEALADAAEVLTAEQRQALAERLARFHGRHRH